ncbi:hypothetical protein HK105_207476 [Polyrhizophydium stewartii]|uniref:Tetratricopeptide repeat protein n=1 Tax=Polyrhizophydium stewartii TaxID=2732419 RepID=A0ABR4N0P9_9FUNG
MQRESSRQPTRETEKAVLSELESLVSSKQLPHKCRALGRDRIELDTLNPKCFDAFLDAFDIDSHLTLSIKVAETEAPLDYLSLQREQNKDVEEGVSLARNGREEDALKKYKAALDMDADCVDALVARGAALVKLGRLVPAVKDLERAVSLDPSDKNAQKYLQQARDALGQELQSRKSLLRGEFVMPADFDPRNAAPAAATHELYPLIPDLGHEDREMERHRTRHRSSKKTKKKRKRKKSHRSRGSSSESDSADTDSDASSRRTNSSQDGSHDDREVRRRRSKAKSSSKKSKSKKKHRSKKKRGRSRSRSRSPRGSRSRSPAAEPASPVQEGLPRPSE